MAIFLYEIYFTPTFEVRNSATFYNFTSKQYFAICSYISILKNKQAVCNGGCIWMHHHKLQIAMLMIFVPACSRGGSMPLPPAARHPSSNGTHTGQQPTPLSHSAQKHRYKASNLTSQSSPIRDTTRRSFPSNLRRSDNSLRLPGGPPTKWDPPGSGANYRI